MASSRALRLHHRERVIASRMRFLRENWHVDTERWPWFTPGRFAKIHPGRVCSCDWCQQHYERPSRGQVRRMIEEEIT